jgi:hypothetical protein
VSELQKSRNQFYSFGRVSLRVVTDDDDDDDDDDDKNKSFTYVDQMPPCGGCLASSFVFGRPNLRLNSGRFL